jgi:DNA-binding IclR family transcriptional regulator
MPRNDPIKSLRRGLGVLYAVAGAEGGRSAAEIAHAVGVEKANIYRVIQTLEKAGMLIRRNQPLRFMLGPGIAELNHLDMQRHLLTVASNVLFRAHAQFARSAIYLVEFVSGHGYVRLTYKQNQLIRKPGFDRLINIHPYDKASSLVFLAFADERELADFYRNYPFEPEGLALWGSRKQLERAVLKIRRESHAAMEFTSTPAAFRVAAPVFGPNQRIIAAVSSAVSLELPSNRREKLVGICRKAASEITIRLARITAGEITSAKP